MRAFNLFDQCTNMPLFVMSRELITAGRAYSSKSSLHYYSFRASRNTTLSACPNVHYFDYNFPVLYLVVPSPMGTFLISDPSQSSQRCFHY